MNLQIYQAYYDNNQLSKLDPNFIPYDNTVNEAPHLREYPMWKKLYGKHKESDAHWGLMSWRWHEKTGISAHEFKEWVLQNPGYDCYHFDPFSHLANQFPNLWVQGDIWHPGMLKYANKLFPKLGITEPAEHFKYQPEDFGTCNYYIGNNKFWTSILDFFDLCLKYSEEDAEMRRYIYEDGRMYNGHVIPNFSFVMERLFSLHNVLNRHITIKKFPK